MPRLHEQPNQNLKGESTNKLPRKERVKRWVRAGALAVGIAATGVGGAHAISGNEVVAGHASASTERHEKDSVKYYRSEERNERIGQDAENFAKRIIDNANKHPELPSRFDDFDPATGKEDGRGLLTTTVRQGDRTYDLSVSVKKEKKGYQIDTRDTKVKVTYYLPDNERPGITRYEGAVLEKQGDERDDGTPTWDASTGSGFRDQSGQGGGGGYESSLETAENPSTSRQMLVEAEQFTLQKMDELMRQAHV